MGGFEKLSRMDRYMRAPVLLGLVALEKTARVFFGKSETVEGSNDNEAGAIVLRPDPRGKPRLEQDRRDLVARRQRDRLARDLSLPPDRVYAVMRERRALERKLVHDHQATVK